ncbi:MAG: SLC13/DASS family transporter [Nitrososphaeraceae archaeon]|nr:SLC13/DASS family transporter [Nitrososphaeraceae archaeon]
MLNPKQLWLILGPISFILIITIFPTPEGLSEKGKYVFAISVWMIIWWITEAIHVYATSLLPLGLMPVTGVLPLEDVAAEYMHPIIVLLLGMFLIAIAIEKSGFHIKVAYEIIGIFGYSPKRIVFGFIVSTAALSTVVMSTTVVLIMLPIAFVILAAISEHGLKISQKFRTMLFLGIAYSSSIGSVSTLIGAPPNLLYAGTVREIFNHTVTFAEWSLLGAPLSIAMLLIMCLYVMKVLNNERIEKKSNNNKIVEKKEIANGIELKKIMLLEKERVGKITSEQKLVVGVLILVLVLMFTSPMWIATGSFITNSVIAILGGISLFALPKIRSTGSRSLLDWAEVERLPFGLLFLLGGGLALSLAFVDSGLANWIARSLSFIAVLPFEIVVMLIVGLIMFMSNVKSNTSTAAIFIPIVANMTLLNNWTPLPILFGITIASSFAFLLPMGTPPNALVYERGKVTMKDMFVNGIVLNFIAIALITIFTIFISPIFLLS